MRRKWQPSCHFRRSADPQTAAQLPSALGGHVAKSSRPEESNGRRRNHAPPTWDGRRGSQPSNLDPAGDSVMSTSINIANEIKASTSGFLLS